MIVSKLFNIPFLRKFSLPFLKIEAAIDTFRSRRDISEAFYRLFQENRNSNEYQAEYSKPEPLVSVCVGTYNRSELLLERCLPSIRQQTYERLEIVVVGDCCTDETEDRIRQINEKRLVFKNLPSRGEYPSKPNLRWMVAGTVPVNEALNLAKGDFITHLDDDDEYLPDRISQLVQFIQEEKADFVSHPFWRQMPDGKWELNDAKNFRITEVTTSSSFYHRWFKQIPWDIQAYRYKEPGDWNRFRKFKYLGVKWARYPNPLLRHYRERSQQAQ